VLHREGRGRNSSEHPRLGPIPRTRVTTSKYRRINSKQEDMGLEADGICETSSAISADQLFYYRAVSSSKALKQDPVAEYRTSYLITPPLL
jgi:hypothetical protein